MGLVVERARLLADDDLDWQPPDGGWPLRRVLPHVARSEVLYATAFDDALPDVIALERELLALVG